jgi:hypothetical protein
VPQYHMLGEENEKIGEIIALTTLLKGKNAFQIA